MNLREFADKAKMNSLSAVDRYIKANDIVVAVTKIAEERGISEEEAYEVFLYGKTRKEQLQEQAKQIVFAESEITADLLVGLADNGIREINIAPDDEYMEYLQDNYYRSY